MFRTGRVETFEILLAMQDVDVLPVESGLEQGVHGRLRIAGVADDPEHAIRRVWCVVLPVFSAHLIHGHDPVQRYGESNRAVFYAR
jgi:hypothetical protein